MHRQRLWHFMIVVWASVALSGCFVEGAVQNAIDALNKNSADWQKTLADLEEKLRVHGDSLVAVEVQSVANLGVAETGKNHVDWWIFGHAIPVSGVSGKQLRICISPIGKDTWKFTFRLFGTYGDSPTSGHCALNPAGTKCYIFDDSPRFGKPEGALSNDKLCEEWRLP